jgi:hypothetical protein
MGAMRSGDAALPAGIGTRPAAAAFRADPKSLAMIEGPAFCRALVH